MNSHGIQQLGTPEDIYLRPANVEIARLFGDPVINLLEVRPDSGPRGMTVQLSENAVPLPGFSGAISRDCLLGLRPETLHFVPEGTFGAFAVEVETETPLNEKTVTLALTLGGHEIMVSRPATMPGPAQGRAWLSVDAASALLFDRATGERLPPTPLGIAA